MADKTLAPYYPADKESYRNNFNATPTQVVPFGSEDAEQFLRFCLRNTDVLRTGTIPDPTTNPNADRDPIELHLIHILECPHLYPFSIRPIAATRYEIHGRYIGRTIGSRVSGTNVASALDAELFLAYVRYSHGNAYAEKGNEWREFVDGVLEGFALTYTGFGGVECKVLRTRFLLRGDDSVEALRGLLEEKARAGGCYVCQG